MTRAAPNNGARRRPCTNATPRRVFADERYPTVDPSTLAEARTRYARAHLPQGAPTSPALANICAYRVDCRLTGLADWAGAVYTRYADNLALSGGDDFADAARREAMRTRDLLETAKP